MSARRVLVLLRGLGYELERKHAPAPSPSAESGASVASVTSLREFARVLANPQEAFRG